MIMEPNDFLVICADTDYWNNGVACQGAFLYQTFGGGFGLSILKTKSFYIPIQIR